MNNNKGWVDDSDSDDEDRGFGLDATQTRNEQILKVSCEDGYEKAPPGSSSQNKALDLLFFFLITLIWLLLIGNLATC